MHKKSNNNIAPDIESWILSQIGVQSVENIFILPMNHLETVYLIKKAI